MIISRLAVFALSFLATFKQISADVDYEQCADLKDLGTVGLDRFNYSIEMKQERNEAGTLMYEVDMKFQHDETMPIPNDPLAQCTPGRDAPFADDGLPYFAFRWHYEQVPEEIKKATGIDNISIDYSPCGHPPVGVFTVPHYDVHVYRADPQLRSCMICEKIPGAPVCNPASQDTVNGQAFFDIDYSTMLGSGKDGKAVMNMPSSFHVGAGDMVPLMGGHAWDEANQPSPEKPFVDPVWVMGTYDKDIAFYEPMLPLSFITGNDDSFFEDSLTYADQTINSLPSYYSVDYDASTKMSTLTFKGEVHNTAIDPDHFVGSDYEFLGKGPCRGPGGVNDKVNSMSAVEHTQEMCEKACDDRREDEAPCLGYAYCHDCNGGECILYGPNLAGVCTDDSAKTPSECEALGSCSVRGHATSAATEGECGSCTDESTAKSSVTCEVVGGTWMKYDWTSSGATWSDPEDPWSGDSQLSSVIKSTTGESSSQYACYDLHTEDHLAHCTGTATDTSLSCIGAFEELAESDRNQSACPAGCTFTAAPKAPRPVVPHEGDIGLPGWDSAMSGACRGGADFTDKVNGKYSNTAGANGRLTQAECATACLDEPGCIGYAHSKAWCVVYGPGVDEGIGTENDGDWTTDTHVSTSITGTKVNPAYICVTGPPRSEPSEPASGYCFSGMMEVETRDLGLVTMKDLSIGDFVRSSSGSFDEVYSFGHRNIKKATEYLQLRTTSTKPLEVSKEHMIGVLDEGKINFIPASSVKIGDTIPSTTEGAAVVKSITSIWRKGAYAPFTRSGTIIVNNLLASNYIAFEDSSTLTIGGISTGVSYQWIAHAFQSVHRMAQQVLPINESYNADGVSSWVADAYEAATIFMGLRACFQAVLFVPFLAGLASLSLLEKCLSLPFSSLILIAGTIYWRVTPKKNIK